MTTDHESAFQLVWANKKLDHMVQTNLKLIEQNDQLYGMLEVVIDSFDHYSVGDLWTQEDMLIIRDIKQQIEELAT